MYLAKAMTKQKRVLSPSSQPTIAKEEDGHEHKKEGVCAKHRRLLKKRVQSGRPHSRLQIKDDMSFSPFSLYPSRAFANTAGGGQSRRKKCWEGKKKKKERTYTRHLPMTSLSHSTTATHLLRSAARHHGNVFV